MNELINSIDPSKICFEKSKTENYYNCQVQQMQKDEKEIKTHDYTWTMVYQL